jgi:hypothetical protein
LWLEDGSALYAVDAVAEDEPIDIHHLTSWVQMRCMGQNPDVLKNLGVAHTWCNQGWTVTSEQRAEIRQRFAQDLQWGLRRADSPQ